MNKLEAQIIVENTGNYDEEDTEYVLETYEELDKHRDFKDNRRDKRFIVKFHDIFYYMPEEFERDHEDLVDSLFEDFCWQQSEYIEDAAREEDIDMDIMFSNMYVGHYQAFLVDIPEITDENIIDLAMNICDEVGYKGKEYVKGYIYLVDLLQDLEDNYMTYWIEFLKDNELIPEKYIKEIEDKYKANQERRK